MNESKRSLNLLVVDNYAMGYMQEQFGRFIHNRGYNITWYLMSSNTMRNSKSYKFGFAEVIFSPKMPSGGKISTLINYFFYKPLMGFVLPKIIKSRKIDIVFVRNEVRITILAYLVCKFKQIPFVYYLAYPMLESHLLAVRRGQRSNRLMKELAAIIGIPLRNWVTRKADFVFTMSDYWANKIVNELRLSSRKVMSIPCGFDATIQPESVDGEKIRNHFNLSNYPTLFYMGTIAPPREPTFLTEIILHVVQSIPEARFIILYGYDQEQFVPIIRQGLIEHGIEKNVVFAPPVPYQQVSMYIRASHVGISPIETIPVFNVSSPHKFVEMLGMECPVVASETPDQKYVLDKSGGGICVPYDSGAFAKAVVYLLRNPDKAKEMGKKGRAFVERERSYGIIAKKIDKVIRTLVCN